MRIAAREGVHDGAALKQKLNMTPSRATRSKDGVFTTLSPYTPACGHDQSSARQKRMFGMDFATANETTGGDNRINTSPAHT